MSPKGRKVTKDYKYVKKRPVTNSYPELDLDQWSILLNVILITSMKNYCYIDGQNLHLGTASAEPSWTVDLHKFRVYLREKYHVEKAFYFLGYVQDGIKIEQLYESIQNAGFILVFRQHNSAMIGQKKGNVDTDIIFSVMKRLYKDSDFNKIVLVSGDGDYKMLIDFLIEENKLEKILFPNKKFRSSLYNQVGAKYFACLDDKDVKKKIAYITRSRK